MRLTRSWAARLAVQIEQSPWVEAVRDHGPQQVFRVSPWLTKLVTAWSLLAFFVTDLPVRAATQIWSGSSGGLWTLPSNWVSSTVPGALDIGSFHLSEPSTVYLNGNTSVLGLELGGSESLNLFGGTSNSVLQNTLNVGAAGLFIGPAAGALSLGMGTTVNVTGSLSGSGGLLKTGDGVLRLSGTTGGGFTGDVAVNSGILAIMNSTALTGVTAPISVGGATGFGFSGGMLVLDGGTAGMTLSQGVTLAGRGPLATNNTAGVSMLSLGNNTISGPVVMAGPATSALYH